MGCGMMAICTVPLYRSIEELLDREFGLCWIFRRNGG